MITKLNLLASISAVLVSTSGCVATESENILTRGMFASIAASADGTGSTTVTATLYLGPPTDLVYIDLVGGDELIAHNGAQSKIMSEQNFLNIVSHYASFAVDDENAEFEVEFRRQIDAGAPSSLVSLPPQFTLDSVPASYSRGDDFGVTWTGISNDRMRWDANGSCIESTFGNIAAGAGSAEMPSGTFKKLQGMNIADSCQVRVTFKRERDGDLDLAYGEGGTITGEQVRSLTFTSTP